MASKAALANALVIVAASLQQLLLSAQPCGADVFTAMVDLENLLTSEAATTSRLIEQYIDFEGRRLRQLKEFVSAQTSSRRTSEAVLNPVGAYQLIKELAHRWKHIQELMHSNHADLFIRNITQGRIDNAVQYPTDDDLDGAAIGLLRLQDTYLLSTSDLASGLVAGDYVGKALTAQDCFEVARAAYNGKDYYHCLQWSGEALRRVADERPTPTVRESDVLEYYAYALYQQGNPQRALAATRRLAELDPHHPRAQGNVHWYEEKLHEADMRDPEDEDDHLPPVKNERSLAYDILERDDFERLCRGEFAHQPVTDPAIYCHYKRDRPFLRLAPLKVEILRHEPLVVIFRGVLSDEEIAVVKELATPRLKRATVQNAKTGELEFASYRISKSAWLKGHLHPVIHRINQRIDMMTNLDQETSEDLQVANYGIGGHYDPHYDFARKEETKAFKNLGTGNRIATVLFYMSQPEKGGATVYTDLKSGVFPSLHDALFWYNLKRDGEGDLRTRHAACPVLTGVKWVSNKWIHEVGQEFRRPCGLTPEASERFVGDLS